MKNFLLPLIFLIGKMALAMPTITSFTPIAGPIGTTVTITGTNFSTTPANNIVYFGAAKAMVTAATTTQLTVTVPAGATSITPITVQDITTGLQASSLTTIVGSGATKLRQFTVTTTIPFTPNYGAATTYTFGNACIKIVTGDFDGINGVDIATVDFFNNNVAILLNNGNGAFTQGTSVNVDTNPFAIAVADFNSDGKMDLAVEHMNGGVNIAVSIRLGNGNGTFYSPATPEVPSGISNYAQGGGIVAGDFNGDGKMDFATHDYGPGSLVYIRLGDGLGGFSAAADVSAGASTYPYSLAVGDFNGDGKADLATANINAVSVSIRLGDGNGAFTGSTSVPVGSGPDHIQIGDFNGDGKLDFATSNVNDHTISIKLGDGSGNFSSGSLLAVVDANSRLALGDFNGDGKTDIVTGNITLNGLRMFLGDGSGGATVGPDISSGGFVDVTVGDFNGDGKADLAAITAGNTVKVFVVVAPITPTITSFTPSSGTIGTTVTITGTSFSTTPANNIVYFGATRANVSAATSTQLTVTVPTGATYQPITVQVNGLTAYSSKPFIITFGVGGNINACSTNPKVDFGVGAQPYEVALGDLDGDGKSDMVVTNYNSKTISVFRNTASSGSITAGSFAPKVDFIATTGTAYTQGVALGDIDGDGKLDIVVTNYIDNSGTATVAIFRNTSVAGSITSGSFATRVDFTCPGAFFVAIRDLDGDGKPEIAVTTYFNKAIAVFRNVSTPGIIDATSLSPQVNFPTTLIYSYSIAIDDIDGDGKPDLIATNINDNTVSVLRNTSTQGVINATSFAPRVEFVTGSIPYYVTVGDLDNDQKPELVVSNYGGSSISIYKNISTAGTITLSSLSPKVDFVTAANPQHIAITDFDGDGKPDLALVNSTAVVDVYKNTTVSGTISSGSFSLGGSFATGFNPYGVTAGDLDGDGKPDLVTANFGSNSVSVIRNAVLEVPSPTITSFNPSTAVIGTTINILGTNFSTTPANNIVKFNGTTAIVTASTATSITTSVPVGASSGTITVTVGCNTATSIGSFIIGTPCTPGTIDSGGLDTTFDPQIQNPVPIDAVELQSTGKIIVLTQSSIQIGGTYYLSGLLRFNSDGSVDPSFNYGGPSGTKHQMIVQPDDKIITMEDFGYSRDLYRLNADGTFDKTLVSFVVATYSEEFGPIALQPDGKIIYTWHDTFAYMDNLTRLNSDGSSDPSLIAPTDLHVSVIKPQADGTILVGSSSSPGIYKLDEFGSFDPTFDPGSGTDNQVFDMAIQPDGKIILVGLFTSFSGVTRNGIVRLNADGSLDTSFDPGSGFQLYEVPHSVLLQPDGKIIVGGNFLSYNGNARIDLVRINPDGTLDCSFDGGPNINTGLVDIALQTDGKIIGVGDLTTYENTTRNGLVRVNTLGTSSCVPTTQRNALIALYNSTNGSGWTNNTNWGNGDASTWFGVTVTGCNVTKVELPNNNLAGSLPTEIGDLTSLIELKLSFNHLSGNLPSSITNLSNLEILYLDNNVTLNGPLPSTIGNMTALREIVTQVNAFTGPIPPSMASCVALENIHLEGNQHTGVLPPYFSTFPNLYSINLGFNLFTGTIPTQWGSITNLKFLSLTQNNLTGSIPIELGSLSNLVQMDLSRNQLSGSIPAEFGNLSAITFLEVYTNQLTGTIPPQLGNATTMKFMRLSENLLTGSIPTSFGNLTELFLLDLDRNQLTGPIPPEFGNLINMKFLNLYDNQLNGAIPPELGNMTQLEVLNIFTNKLTGRLPVELAQCTNLTAFEVAENLLSGTLPIEYQSLVNLTVFQINDNQFTGGVPVEYLAWTNIKDLYLSSNQLDAIPTFPTSGITNLAVYNNNLEFGDLESNIGITGYVYNPQTNLPGGNTFLCGGSTLTIPFTTTGTANTYQWFKNGVLINGATSASFSKSNVTSADAGNYTVQVKSSIVPGLTLTTNNFVVTINVLAKPVVITTNCTTSSATLSGPTGFASYFWSDDSDTQQIIVTTPGSYTLVVTDANGCSAVSDPTTFSSTFCNKPPTFNLSNITVPVQGTASLNLISLISDPDNNLDLASLKILIPPTSGALASINQTQNLLIDYTGINFSGIDHLTIEICDLSGACAQQELAIDVVGEVTVYNALSPGSDGKNDLFYLEYINILEATKTNEVKIFNRWGDVVWEGTNYDNDAVVFTGLNSNGNELPSGVYFYKITFGGGAKALDGFISLKN